MRYEKLPIEIRNKGLFCCWKHEEINGRNSKIPYDPITGERAKSNDRTTFTQFDVASSKAYDGIGIGIFDGVCAIDLDHCIAEDGTFAPYAQSIVDLMHSYTEYSPSSDGLHILFRTEGFTYDSDKYYIMNHKNGIEVYVAGATNKFVTVTGNEIGTHYEFGDRTEELMVLLEQYMKRPLPEEKTTAVNAINAGNTISDDRELLDKAMNSRNGRDFQNLWNGNWQGKYQSQSEADMALCSSLSFWTGADAGRMDQLFRQSGLMRAKWDRHQSGSTYGALTIRKAIQMTTDVYTPKMEASYPASAGNKADQPAEVCNETLCAEKDQNSAQIAGEKMDSFPEVRPLKPQQNMLPTFPTECLPPILRDYVSAVAEHSQTSPDMAAVIGLGVLSVCLQGKYQVQGIPGYTEPLSLYVVVTAAPGERKSSVMKDMTKYISEYEADYNKQQETRIRENNQQREAIERKINGIKKKLENKNSEELELQLRDYEAQLEQLPELQPARFFADDCTSEALTSLIADNHGIFSVISTEGGIFDIIAGLYSGKGNTSNIDVWLKGHCGDPIRVDRKGRKTEYIPKPALSAILSIQPSVLDEIMSNTTMSGRGLIARFLYSNPASRIGSRIFCTEPISPEIEQGYKNLIYQLMALEIPEEPKTLSVSRNATASIAEYFAEHEKYLIGEGQGISDWASKYIGSVLCIAGLLHLAQMQREDTEISEETMMNAITIGKYFLAHSMYAYSMMGTDISIQKARFVWGKIEKKKLKEIKRSDLFQMCRGKFFKETKELFPTLDLLAENGYLRLEEQPRLTAGRPADIRVIINQNAFGMSGV